MTIYGLTDDGFVPKTTEIVRDSLNERIRSRQGASMDLSDEDPLGQVVGLIAAELGELWEVTEDVNAQGSRDNATGAGLDAVGLLTGSFRPDAKPSTVTLTLTGAPTTVVPAASQSRTDSTEAVFRHTEDCTIAATDAWASTTGYVVGDRVTNASRVYYCRTAGTSAGSGGPSTTSEDITDGTAHWRYLGEGTGDIDVEAECEDNGATVALAGDIDHIVTPVSGWESVTNLLDAELGRDEALDAEYRLVQEVDLASPGTGTVDAIKEALLEIEGVTRVKIFVNNTDVTDVDGLPPHSIEALVRGGDDQDIWDALLANVAAGIATYGDEDGTAEDSEGNSHDMFFSRPDEITIWAVLDAYFPTGEVPTDAATQVKTALVAAGDARDVGANANVAQVYAGAMSVDGVFDVANVTVDSVDPAVATSVAVNARQLAVWDSSRITVNVLTGTP